MTGTVLSIHNTLTYRTVAEENCIPALTRDLGPMFAGSKANVIENMDSLKTLLY